MKKLILLLLCSLFCLATHAQTADELYQKAKNRNEKKDYNGAVALIDKAIALKPTCDYYYVRAIYVHNSGDKEGAQKQARDIIDIFPDSVKAWMDASSFFIAIQDFDRSLEIADSMITHFPIVSDSIRIELYMFRGTVKTSMNDHVAAEIDFKVAYAIDSTNEEVLIDLAGVYDELDRDEEAVRLMKRALAINPGNERLYNNLGFLYDNMGRYKEAIEMFNTSIARNKGKDDFGSRETTGFSYSNRGHAKYKLGDNKGAMKDFAEAEKLTPYDPYMYKNRALVYIAMGKNREACLELYRAISLGYSEMYGNEVEKLINAYCR